APPSQNSIRHTLKRLTDAIEAAEAVVEAAELSRSQTPEETAAEAEPIEVDGPDPVEIWGEDTGNGSAARLAEREHRRKSATRRRLEHSRPGKAYANWKYRRSELE
ncbi:MAG TPA: hypothetical protein VKA30_10985, partial [Actinomycetota bacterium]|nr:hypothetical protein [Actinomycetota bacterium]